MSLTAGTHEVPAPADGVQLAGEVAGSGYRTPPALVRRADGQVVQLTRLLYLVLREVDGRRTFAEIAERVGTTYGRPVSADNVRTLVRDQLRPLGLLRREDGTEPELRRSDPLLGLRFRYVVTDPALTRRLTAPFAGLLHPVLVTLVVAGFLAVCWWVLFERGLASATHAALYQPEMLLTVFAITVLSAGFHEFGHAAAARYGGATPGAMGMGLYLIWPAFYTDVTDSYRLDRAGRVRTDLGGLYFNAIVAVAMYAVWWATGWEALLLIIATQILQMLRQLTPLVRFDGYHVLADLTGVPDLYQHIKPTLLGLLPRNWGRPQVLKPWARAVVTLWVAVVVPLLLVTLGLLVFAFPRIAATAWDSLTEEWRGLVSDARHGDVLGATAEVLSIVAVALPLLGMVYLVVRVLQRVSAAVWRRTEGHPGRRAVAAGTAGLLLAGVAWAWWPDGEAYRPIRPYERGAVQDVGLALGRTPAGLEAGRITRASAVWPEAEPLPTAERPRLALVLVPRDGSDPVLAAGEDGELADGAWVFPFDRPPAPGEGDNQALAINTVDGSTLYDVAFALVWVEDGRADNVNSAYALASCERCRTVAIAFQVVLVVGEADVVPQNLAAAVNYRCVECVTRALARQLVITLDRPLSPAAQRELDRLWRRISAYGERAGEIPLAELQERLGRFQKRIKRIVARDLGASDASLTPTTSPTPGTSTAPTSSAGVTGSPTPSSSISPSPSTSTSPSASPTGTSDGAPSGSTSPSASPTGSTTSTSPSATSSPSGSTSPSPTGSTTGASPSASPTG